LKNRLKVHVTSRYFRGGEPKVRKEGKKKRPGGGSALQKGRG